MGISEVNWLGVIAAWFVAFIIAFNWFSGKAFYPVWMRSMGKQPGEGHDANKGMATIFGLTILSGIFQAFVLSVILIAVSKANAGNVDLVTGGGIGFLAGCAIATAALGHFLFAGRTMKTWVIEFGNDILNWTAMGIVLSFFY
jgi:hypothetical protein